jgi:hypothetical protein
MADVGLRLRLNRELADHLSVLVTPVDSVSGGSLSRLEAYA